MIPLKSYLIRAVRDWAVDNGCTPHVVVDAARDGVKVPPNYVKDGRIILNIHPRAVDAFDLDDSWLRFAARFSSRSINVEIPLAAVLAVYGRENGQGISFPEKENGGGDPEKKLAEPERKSKRKGPNLKIIK